MTSPSVSSVGYFNFILFKTTQPSFPMLLTSCNNKTVLGRFSGLHKLQILDFIFNDPTILGNFQVRRRDTNKLFFFTRWPGLLLQEWQCSEDAVLLPSEIFCKKEVVYADTLCKPAGGDGGGSSCSREPEEVQGLGEKCGGNASQIQGWYKYKYRYSAKYEVVENLIHSCL